MPSVVISMISLPSFTSLAPTRFPVFSSYLIAEHTLSASELRLKLLNRRTLAHTVFRYYKKLLSLAFHPHANNLVIPHQSAYRSRPWIHGQWFLHPFPLKRMHIPFLVTRKISCLSSVAFTSMSSSPSFSVQ